MNSSIRRPAAHLAILAFLVFALAATMRAQSINEEKLPLGRFLRPDGTLSSLRGFSGSLDPSGWRLRVAPDGRPQFVRTTEAPTHATVASDTADVHWDTRFTGPSGVDGFIFAMAKIGDDFYFGGEFSSTDHILASNIVKWNSSTGAWSSLGDGIVGLVFAMSVIGSDLYVGGSFATAGGVPAHYIAKWNGSAWSSLGTPPNDGVNSLVYAMTVSGTNLYVGGGFTTAGGTTTVNHVARWDGSNWSALGAGVNGEVDALAIMGSDLVAAGAFTSAGGNPARHIARWTGTAWATLGSSPNDGTDDRVFALNSAPPYLYVGGRFTTVGPGTMANHVARWNGTAWSALGNGLDNSVTAIATVGSRVYVGGDFTASGITAANSVAVWDTGSSTWSGLNQGVDVGVSSLLPDGSNVYIAGYFSAFINTGTPVPANRIARWNGSSWESLGTSSNASVNGTAVTSIALSGTDIYIGGAFSVAGTVAANNIVRYNIASNTWTPLGSGVDDAVFAIAVGPTGNVYAGGSFLKAGGNPARHIAVWNGSAWSTLGTSPNDGTDNTVRALAINGTDVYVGGAFTSAGSIAATYIARWNGSTWSSLGSGMDDWVMALAIKGSDLYAGGYFLSAGGIHANEVARWNGTAWNTLGTAPHDGVNAVVRCFALLGSKLFVGGGFDSVAGGTIPASSIASWDGSSWAPLGNGVNGTVYAITPMGKSLFVTGQFETTGILTVNSIARWDTSSGGSWSGLGSGLVSGTPDGGDAIAAVGGALLVGGDFTEAGGKPSFRLGLWDPTLNVTSVAQPAGPRGFTLDQNYPNPFNPSTAISYQLSTGGPVSLKVYDILGRQVSTLVNHYEQPGRHTFLFDASGLASGVYIYRLVAGGSVDQKKMLLVR